MHDLRRVLGGTGVGGTRVTANESLSVLEKRLEYTNTNPTPSKHDFVVTRSSECVSNVSLVFPPSKYDRYISIWHND